MAVNTPLKTDEIKPKYEVIEYEGKPARLYPDGAIRNERGHWLAAHPAGHTITQADARELRDKGYRMAQEAIREAVMREIEGIADIPVNTPESAYAFVVGKQTIALIDSDKPRFDDVERLGQLMGTVERPRDRQQTQQAGLPIPQGDDLVMIVMRRRLDAGVVDGEVIPMRSDLQGDAE